MTRFQKRVWIPYGLHIISCRNPSACCLPAFVVVVANVNVNAIMADWFFLSISFGLFVSSDIFSLIHSVDLCWGEKVATTITMCVSLCACFLCIENAKTKNDNICASVRLMTYFRWAFLSVWFCDRITSRQNNFNLSPKASPLSVLFY